MAARVAVIGDALLDVTIVPSEPMRHGGDVPGAVRVGPGGQAANVAVRLSRRGIQTRLACALGDDQAGTLVRRALEGDGVELEVLPAEATGAVAILLDGIGERTMVSRRAALVPALREADLGRLVRDAGWLVVSGYVLLERAGRDLGASLGALPVRRVVLGCSPGGGGAAQWVASVASLRPDLVILNGDEAAGVVDSRPSGDDGLAAEVAARFECVAIVTDRGRATAALNGGARVAQLSEGVAVPRDSTGAGDAFAAAVVASLDPDAWPPDPGALRTALDRGLAAAAEVVAVHGAQAVTAGERSSLSA